MKGEGDSVRKLVTPGPMPVVDLRSYPPPAVAPPAPPADDRPLATRTRSPLSALWEWFSALLRKLSGI